MKPQIAFVPIDNMKMKKSDSYATVYKQGIVENEYRNEWISRLATTLAEHDRTVLILVKHVSHGKTLEEMIPNSVFIYGGSTKKKRESHIDNMRAGLAKITISSVIFDEGMNIQNLDALILAGSGKSSTRALQRIGRVIRKHTYPDGRVKTNAYVYDFFDYLPFLSNHARARMKIYKTEPEFQIRKLNDIL